MNANRRHGLGLALAAAGISAVSVSVNASAVRAFADPTVYTTGKNIVAALLIALAAIAARGRARPVAQPPRTRRHSLALVVVAVVGGSTPFVLFFEGLARASSAQAAFLQKTLVFWVAALAVAFLGERVGWPQLAAIALLLAGQAGLAKAGAFPLDAGAILILAATVLWALEVIVAKRLLATVSSRTVALARMGGGSLVLLGWLAVTGRGAALARLDAGEWGWLAITGPLLAAYVCCWLAALARAQAVDVTAVLVLGAVGTALLSGVVDPGPLVSQAIWLILIAAGGLLAARSMLRRGEGATA